MHCNIYMAPAKIEIINKSIFLKPKYKPLSKAYFEVDESFGYSTNRTPWSAQNDKDSSTKIHVTGEQDFQSKTGCGQNASIAT